MTGTADARQTPCVGAGAVFGHYGLVVSEAAEQRENG